MDAPSERITIRTSYNLGATSFTPAQMAESIRGHIPDFKISYKPDYRQEIADTWPESINDSKAREDWGWEPRYGLEDITTEMLARLDSET
jgi:nucleoside-diphosphate-sugar epimerase